MPADSLVCFAARLPCVHFFRPLSSFSLLSSFFLLVQAPSVEHDLIILLVIFFTSPLLLHLFFCFFDSSSCFFSSAHFSFYLPLLVFSTVSDGSVSFIPPPFPPVFIALPGGNSSCGKHVYSSTFVCSFLLVSVLI